MHEYYKKEAKKSFDDYISLLRNRSDSEQLSIDEYENDENNSI